MMPPRDKFTEGLMMAAALGVMPRSVLVAVTEVFTPDRLTLDERRFLAGPLVVHQCGWTDTLPAWLHDAVSAERIGIVFGETPQYIVGPAEIAAVMYPATLEAPMRHYYADLYIWASAHAHAKRKGIDPAEFFKTLNMTPIRDDDVLRPGGRLYETYRELAHDMRRRVIAHQTTRDREVKRQTKTEKAHSMAVEHQKETSEPATRPVVVAEQMMLF